MESEEPRAAGVPSLRDGFAAVGPLSFEAAERDLVFALVGTVAGTRRTESIMAAFEATALTDLVVVAQRRADRRRADRRDADLPMREVTSEVSAALRVSDRVAQALLSNAVTLTTAFPRTHAALADGRISPAHVRVIVDAGIVIGDDEARAGYEDAVLPAAERESAGRLKAIAQVLAARANPESIDVRHRRARRARSVRVVDDEDGMATLTAYLPAALAHGIHDRLTAMAHTVRDAEAADAAATAAGDGVLAGVVLLGDGARADDGARANDGATEGDGAAAGDAATARDAPDATTEPPRGIDELRADLLTDLLLSGAPTGHGDGLESIRGHVQITVPVLTMAGTSSEPAVLAGHGPVDLDTARRLAGDAPGWDRVLTHPITSEVLAVDRYRPSEHLRRFLRVRDQHCRFPNCRVPAWRADIDHTRDAALGGETSVENLAHLCEPHHVIKHKTQWRVRQIGGGRLEWTSPTGRTYIDVPERTLMFIADGDPPPF